MARPIRRSDIVALALGPRLRGDDDLGRGGRWARRFGIFDHLDDGGVPLGRLFADRLQLIELYDRAGFYGYHLAEHHATPLGCAPAPGVFLAAVAQRTERLRFGP